MTSAICLRTARTCVYFIGGTTRRQVANPQVMDKYRFAWERVRDVPCAEPRRLPEGPKLR